MEVAMPMANTGAGTSAMDSYEDMFKEITRKLYGEDGLPDIISNEKVSTSTASEIRLSNMDYEMDSNVFKSDEHITALGLAALMQNGFPSSSMLNSQFQQKQNTLEDKWITSDDNLQWTQSKIASYNPSQKLFKCVDCDCVGFLLRVAEHWLGTHANLRVFQCPQCPYASAWARCVRMHVARQHNVISEDALDKHLKDNPVMLEIMRYLQGLKSKYEGSYPKTQASSPNIPDNKSQINSSSNRVNNTENNARNNNNTTNLAAKRYSCNYCPYATDRRDLFTRHENIHREEKPFQCYVCQKQFNRADHVKKHFLRMHREHPYDLNRIRRQPPKNASGMSYYHKYNNDNGAPTMANPPEQSLNVQQNIQNQLTIPNGFRQNPVSPAKPANPVPKAPLMKLSNSKSSCKKKGEKRYTCCYCSWSGVDNWCLKRHLNTHLKPFVCGLCDYKAARSERLATHVLKVHNKRACGRCLYLADDQAQLVLHQQEHHSLEHKNKNSNSMRNSNYNTNQASSTHTLSQSLTPVTQTLKTYDISAAILQHGSRLLPITTSNFLSSANSKPWKTYTPKQHGAARLFNYMEASDGSDNESEQNHQERNTNTSNNNNNKNMDFLEGGDVGIQQNNSGENEDNEEDMELPLFICRDCGCEFIDDISLETHMLVHHQSEKVPTSPKVKSIHKKLFSTKKHIKTEKNSTDSKEDVKVKNEYICVVCKVNFGSQANIMNHMKTHMTTSSSVSKEMKNNCKRTNESYEDVNENMNGALKRPRKQNQPKKVESLENQEIQVIRGTSLKQRQWKTETESDILLAKLREKHLFKLMNRKGYTCNLCIKKSNRFFPSYTKSALTQHYMFKHYAVKNYKCEHCSMTFRHQYQVVLHSSQKHIYKSQDNNNLLLRENQVSIIELDKTVPNDNKSTNNCNNVSSISANENNEALNSINTTNNVPDNSTCVDKLNISYLEQPMINNGGTQQMPITIPTFPPT